MTGKRLSRVTLAIVLAGSAVLALRAVASYRAASSAIVGGAGEDGPSALFERTEHDFGQVDAGEELSIAFAVHNPGTQRLVLIPAGCVSCAQQAGLDSIIVPPRGAAEVVITLDTSGLTGDVRHVARYTTSAARQPQVEFVVTGRVEPPTSNDGERIPTSSPQPERRGS